MSYTIDRSEYQTVNALVVATASLHGASPTDPNSPIWPVSVDRLSSGWAGAEWVRYVANYQDNLSEGYATLKDLSRAHEFTDDLDLDFVPRSEVD